MHGRVYVAMRYCCGYSNQYSAEVDIGEAACLHLSWGGPEKSYVWKMFGPWFRPPPLPFPEN